VGDGGGRLSLLPSPYPNPNYTVAAKLMHTNSEQTVQTTETHVYKITNVPVFEMALGLKRCSSVRIFIAWIFLFLHHKASMGRRL
jgi:hypothetical protein